LGLASEVPHRFQIPPPSHTPHWTTESIGASLDHAGQIDEESQLHLPRQRGVACHFSLAGGEVDRESMLAL
jgi:hypothetical protein